MARSAVNYTYEADLAFAAPGSNLTASGAVDPATFNAGATFDNASGGLDLETLDKMVNAREGDQKNKMGSEFADVVIAISAADVADTDEDYAFNVYVGATGDNAAGALVGSLVLPTGAALPGQYVIKLDMNTVELLDADRQEIFLDAVLGGTTPDITFAAWLAYGEGKH